jgi:putative ABC transport system permease protein
VPYPVPVVGAGNLPELVTGIDNELIRIERRAALTGIPGAGAAGMLMDLEYAERLALEPGAASEPRVWLTGDAPPEIVDRLREQGLVITADRNADDARAASDEGGAALALRFYLLAAGMAVLVGLGALLLVTAVDRRTWRKALRELYSQGLAERTTTAAALWSYGGMVIAGAVAGGLAAGAAWLGTGRRLPFGVDETALTLWPQWTVVIGAWLAVVAVLLAAAVVAGARRVRD